MCVTRDALRDETVVALLDEARAAGAAAAG